MSYLAVVQILYIMVMEASKLSFKSKDCKSCLNLKRLMHINGISPVLIQTPVAAYDTLIDSRVPKPVEVPIIGIASRFWKHQLLFGIGLWLLQVVLAPAVHAQAVGSASGSLETLMEYFTLRVRWPEAGSDGAPFRLTLSPLYDRIAKRLKVIHVEVDSRRFIPVRLHYVEPSGDETDYLFRGVETNTEIDSGLFELDLPPGVVVTKRNQP